MEPTDLTIRGPQEICSKLQGLRDEQREVGDEQRQFREQSFAHIETIETTLLDLAEQATGSAPCPVTTCPRCGTAAKLCAACQTPRVLSVYVETDNRTLASGLSVLK